MPAYRGYLLHLPSDVASEFTIGEFSIKHQVSKGRLVSEPMDVVLDRIIQKRANSDATTVVGSQAVNGSSVLKALGSDSASGGDQGSGERSSGG